MMAKYKVETDKGSYEVELADSPSKATFAGSDFLDFMPQAGIARRAWNPEDIPGHVANLGQATMTAPVYEYAKQAAMAGPSGAAMASGANTAVSALNRFPNSLLNELYINPPELSMPFKRSFELPQSKTSTGKALDAATTGISLALPFALDKVEFASRVQSMRQRVASLSEQIDYMKANQARPGSAVNPMELTKPGATVKDVNATEAAWNDAQTSLLREQHAVIDREHVAFDQQMLGDLRANVIASRQKAAAWLKSEGEVWSQRFANAAEGKEIPREEAAQLMDGMAQRMGLVDGNGAQLKVNLTPSEARVMRLRNAYAQGDEAAGAAETSGLVDAQGRAIASAQPAASRAPVELPQLYKELLGTKQLRGAPHVDDYALGQAKNYLADFLAERGDADFLQMRSSYGPYAKFRDQIYAFIKPQAGTYNTDAAVNDLSGLLDAASDVNPSRAKNTGDLHAFLSEYRRVDPEMSARLSVASRIKRDLNIAKAQLEAKTQGAIASKAEEFNELRRRAMETYEQTLQRYLKALQSAKTDMERAEASGNLGTFLRKYVLSPTARELPRVLRLGAEFSAAGYVASRALAGHMKKHE